MRRKSYGPRPVVNSLISTDTTSSLLAVKAAEAEEAAEEFKIFYEVDGQKIFADRERRIEELVEVIPDPMREQEASMSVVASELF